MRILAADCSSNTASLMSCFSSEVEAFFAFSRMGDGDRAFASLEAAVAERSPGLVFLKVDRAWDRIRADPRFASFVRRVGIP